MKLNYTNRKISGSKLGSAVKRDLLKHVPSTSKTTRTPKDPHVDLNLQGKSLCDEGLEIACEGLVEAIGSGNVKLDELNLAENKLTLDGLKSLGVVIRLSKNDLKDLDLSCNCIEIVTEEKAEAWEAFLECFRNVCSLRRLDISQNPIGDRGIEILLKVYAREPPIILPRFADSVVAESSDEELDEEFDEELEDIDEFAYAQVRNMSISDSRESSLSPKSFYSSPPKSTRQRAGSVNRRSPSSPPLTISLPANSAELHGLRSIPYLVLCETGITDKAALFLSYIIPIHPTPERLWAYLPRPRVGSQAEIFENYDHTTGCTGIIYQPNENITAEGLRVFHLAEGMRDGCCFPHGGSAGHGSRSRRVSDASAPPATPMKSTRRDSFSAMPSSPHSPAPNISNGGAVTELERARRKIQGNILRDTGPGCVELWRTALRMLVVSRAILFDEAAIMDRNISPYRRSLSQSLASLPRATSANSDSQGSFGGYLPAELLSPNEHSDGVSHSVVSSTSPLLSTSYMSFPHHHHNHHNGNRSQRPDFDLFSPSTECSTTPTIQHGMLTPPTAECNGITTASLVRGLTEQIWYRIIVLAADPKDILTAKQRRNIFDWASTKETLEREREIAGKPRCNQIWKLLEGMECLGIEV
ncbi:hypothetical protein RUND412_001021 [Rhizina undulata]